MIAAWYESFGAARDVLSVIERPDPVAGEGEVRVRLRTSAVNPSDVKKRAGAFPDLLDEGGIVPHSDGAGVIEAVGSGVNAGRVGERVWLYQAQHQRRFGTAAECIAIEAHRAVALPEPVTFEIGACLGIPAMTAHRCVFADGPVAGLTVLVTGGAGRVGHYAIQWAARSGARVIATASNAEDAAVCREAGAAGVVNHGHPDWDAELLDLNGGRPVDRAVEVDFGVNLTRLLRVVRTGGRIATYASVGDPQPRIPFYEIMYRDLTVRWVIVYDMPEKAKQQAVVDITSALEAGWMVHRVAQRMPLSDIAAAHECIEAGGLRGALVLDVG